jgi:hypothetical protein
MKNNIYMQWFFDTFDNKLIYDSNDLFLYQFPIYSLKSNILRQKYYLPIDINNTNKYPNSLPLLFNIKMINDLKNTIKPEKTIESCYLLRKTNDQHPLKMMDNVNDYFIHPPDSINLDLNSLDQNIGIFLKCKKFYCYDNVCFLPVIANVCDCQAIIIGKYPGFEDIKNIYKIYNPWMYYGMAYNDTEEEFNFAKNTKHLLFEFIDKTLNGNFENFFTNDNDNGHFQLLNFLKYIECYFNVSFYEK